MTWEDVKSWTMQKLPAILAGGGIAAWFTSTVLAVKATPEAINDIEQYKIDHGLAELTFFEKVGACWKRYIPAGTSAVAGTLFIVLSVAEGDRRIALAINANDILVNQLKEYKEYRKTTQEQVGEKKESEIYKETVTEQIRQNPPSEKNTIKQDDFADGNPSCPICYFPDFGIYIYATYDQVLQAVNALGEEILGGIGLSASMNDLIDKLGGRTVTIGDYLGWSTETGIPKIPPKEDVTYTGTPSGNPCWVCRFENPPQYDYNFFRR